MASAGGPRAPVFVGGTSRSGTHPVANLLGRSSVYQLVPRELFFHTVPQGLVGYVKGRFDRDELIEALRRRFWRVGSGKAGLEGVVTRAQLDEALDALATAPEDRVAFSRALVETLVDPVARAAGKPSWIEKSTQTVVGAPVLLTMFPEGGVVHVVRDGRDVACSVAKMPWGPDTVPEAVGYWAERLRRADAAARELPPGRVLVIHLEDLVLLDRDATYGRLLDYVGIDSEPAMAAFFESELTAERAHLGRWRTELEPPLRDEVDATYRDTLRELRDEGVTCAPPDRELEVSYSAGEAASPFDPWSQQSV